MVAKFEFQPGELFPRVGFIVTNRSLPNERVLAFYNDRGTAEQHIKEGKYALKWTRLSCMRFTANEVRLQLHALAYNLANFLRTLATPEEIERWSLSSLRERLIKTGARLVRHGRYAIFQMVEVAIPRRVFATILTMINALRISTTSSGTNADALAWPSELPLHAITEHTTYDTPNILSNSPNLLMPGRR